MINTPTNHKQVFLLCSIHTHYGVNNEPIEYN